jgi:hypothetical protein
VHYCSVHGNFSGYHHLSNKGTSKRYQQIGAAPVVKQLERERRTGVSGAKGERKHCPRNETTVIGAIRSEFFAD